MDRFIQRRMFEALLVGVGLLVYFGLRWAGVVG
jgi:hypothetical protein